MPAHEEYPVVLVVDDDADTREFLAALLRSEGYRVACACDGEDALERIVRIRRPVIVLLDMHMPEVDGVVFLERVRHSGLGGNVRVVCMSADYDALDPIQGEVLTKPIDLTKLTRLISDLSSASKRIDGKARRRSASTRARRRRSLVRDTARERQISAVSSMPPAE